jgi:hypothetical protein
MAICRLIIFDHHDAAFGPGMCDLMLGRPPRINEKKLCFQSRFNEQATRSDLPKRAAIRGARDDDVRSACLS